MNIEEGRISVDGSQVWYRRAGSGQIPLLALHGGPAAGHDYLEPLEALATYRTVIFYDQLGCGRSDQPDDRSLWQIERFVGEVDIVRRALGLEQVHLLGHSWGGWLAIEYMLTHPPGVVSVVLASTSASVPQFMAETSRLIAELSPEMYQAMQRYQASGDYHHSDCEAAVREFYRRHWCRLDPRPEPLQRSGANMRGNAVFETMYGTSNFMVTGNLKDWDRTDCLSEITVPTLITVGRYDWVTPACADTLHQGIPKSQMVVFQQSSHVAHLEETDRYLEVVGEFLARVEAEHRTTYPTNGFHQLRQ